MTQATTPSTGVAAFAASLKGTRQQAQANSNQQTSYTIDPKTGNCVFVVGADISSVPHNTFSSSPTMVSTGLTGAGAASFKTGAWLQV